MDSAILAVEEKHHLPMLSPDKDIDNARACRAAIFQSAAIKYSQLPEKERPVFAERMRKIKGNLNTQFWIDLWQSDNTIMEDTVDAIDKDVEKCHFPVVSKPLESWKMKISRQYTGSTWL